MLGEQTVSTQFHSLESNIANVARTAVRIGALEACHLTCCVPNLNASTRRAARKH